jgi:hypothetical protein
MFDNGRLSVGIEIQISHVSEVVVNTGIKLPLSLIFQVFHDHFLRKKSFRDNIMVLVKCFI